MNEVVLVRHGQTEWSVSGRHTGRTDVRLTERGHRQARELATLLAGRIYAAVFCSPLRRARETMEGAGFGGSGRELADLVEWDYGIYEGRTTSEICGEEPGWSLWTSPIRGGESVDQVGARAERVIETLDDVDGTSLVFAHGHLLRILGARWIGLEASEGARLALDTAGVCVLGWEHANRVVVSWNHPCPALPGDDAVTGPSGLPGVDETPEPCSHHGDP